MKKVFIIHGFMGTPNGGWKPWLMSELDKLGMYACALPVFDPQHPIREEWMEEIGRQVNRSKGDEVYLIGHSLGVAAILNYLESAELEQPIAGAFLVAGPYEALETENLTSRIRRIDNFFPHPFDFDKIKKQAKKFVVIHGDNDDRVPVAHGEKIAEELDCELVVVPNGGHLSGGEGWQTLPALLEQFTKEQ